MSIKPVDWDARGALAPLCLKFILAHENKLCIHICISFLHICTPQGLLAHMLYDSSTPIFGPNYTPQTL